MKRTIQLILIFLSPLFVVAKGFTIGGTIEGFQTGTITLAYINASGEDTTLTATITGGNFTFTDNKIEPQLARLQITEGWAYNTNLFLENSAISIHLVKDAPEKTTITGSASQLDYEKLEPGLSTFFEQARQNVGHHQQLIATLNNPVMRAADSLWLIQQGQFIHSISAVITANNNNYAALYFIQWLLFRPADFDSIMSVFMQLSPGVRQSMAGKKFVADFEHLHRIQPGQPAPEIMGNDTAGHPVKLAMFKGKVVLLDFWASFCGPCRYENRNMSPTYRQYHPEGFEIVSLSLDSDRDQWIGALQVDGMTWPQLSELRGGAGATAAVYDVSVLPRNVLIDRTGKIYVKDLHGQDLYDTIEMLLKKGK